MFGTVPNAKIVGNPSGGTHASPSDYPAKASASSSSGAAAAKAPGASAAAKQAAAAKAVSCIMWRVRACGECC